MTSLTSSSVSPGDSGRLTVRRPMSAATEAHVEIHQLVHRYADAVIHRNGSQWRDTWAPDAEWDLGGGRLVEGIDALSELCQFLRKMWVLFGQ